MDNLNVVNDTQGPSVEAQAQTAAHTGAATEVPDSKDTGTSAQQTPEENAAFAAMRRRSEAAERAADKLKSENAALLQKQEGDGGAAARQEQEAGALQELQELRKWRDEKIIDEDIACIKEAYPEFQASGFNDLPEQFLRIMATGGVDPLTAYDIYTMQQNRIKKDPPPALGAIDNSSTREKDYYSPEEVDRLTENDFQSNGKLLDIVQRSMTKWR